MNKREAVRGVSTEGKAREFMAWHRKHRPELPWPVAFLGWVEAVGGLPVDVAREVRIEVLRVRNFGAGS